METDVARRDLEEVAMTEQNIDDDDDVDVDGDEMFAIDPEERDADEDHDDGEGGGAGEPQQATEKDKDLKVHRATETGEPILTSRTRITRGRKWGRRRPQRTNMVQSRTRCFRAQ